MTPVTLVVPGRRTRRLAPAAAVAICLVAAAPAVASTVGIEANPILGGDAMVYRADPGELNQFFFLGSTGDQLGVQDGFDGAVAITPIAPCGPHTAHPEEPRFAQCPAAGLTAVAAFLDDGSDTSDSMSFTPMLIDGGADDDSLTGGFGDDLVLGGAGNDSIRGGDGDDILDGGPGPDDITGAGGIGGGLPTDLGFDLADYGDRTAPVTANLDGQANDGEAGEADLIELDMEGINGGSAGDTLVGDATANFLAGNDGNDVIDGGGGSDLLDAGNGDDTILARDGAADQVLCGAGTDSVVADATDALAGCENVALPAVAPPPVAAPVTPAAAPRDLTAPRLAIRRIAASRLRTVLRRGLTVPVVCSEACTVRATAQFRGRSVAAGRRSGGPGLTTRVTLRFTRSATRRLRRLRTVRLSLRITATDASGNRRTVTRSLTLRR